MGERKLRLPTFERVPDAIAVDLDGTLLNSHTRLSERNRAAIEACVRRGIPVVVATSRPARTARRALGEVADICSLVIMNGAVGRAAAPLAGAVREAFPERVARDVVELILGIEPEARLTVELEGWEFGRNWDSNPEELWRINAATPDMVMTVEEALMRAPAKIAASRGGKDVSDLAAAVSRRYADVVSVVSSNDMTFLNILSVRASKSRTLARLLASRDISLDYVLAFGDDIPDLDLLEACGIPVAVANAVPEVLAVANYCTASNDEDGVAVVLERMLGAIEK